MLVGGDLFVGSPLLVDALRAELLPLGIQAEYVVLNSRWPDVPYQYGGGLHEFVGDPHVVAQLARDAELIVTHLLPVDAQVIASASRLRAIACGRTGPVNIDLAAATARGIPVLYAPGRNSDAVAEFAIGVMLAELRHIARSHAALQAGRWPAELYHYASAGRELRGLTVGLVGCGNVGSRVARLLQPFGARVLAHDPYRSEDEIVACGATPVALDTLLAQAEIVSLHARLTSETVGLIGAREIGLLRRGAYLINTARGRLLDHEALIGALEAGHLAGAALDTFDQEPLPADSPLRHLPNVTLTPHIAGASRQSAHHAATLLARDIGRLLRGERPQHCLNANVLGLG